jgi:hypothetical protein
MADEEIPENLDLRFLAEQSVRILRELGSVRERMATVEQHVAGIDEQTQHIPHIRADIAELQIEFAAMRVDQGRAGKLLEEIYETQRNRGARLNVIDGRLAIIEKHTGLVQA